jgi:CubicO group peptidase (beta-lactamase class C family)
MRLGTPLPAAAAIFLVAAPLAAQPAPAAPPPDLDRHVARVMREFQVPGIGLAVVKDGKVVAARGYGVRRLGDTARVDARTRFGIASNTKAFTATALALLVEEGKLEWDAPVVRYLPAFAMYDPFVTRELTVRDLLVHRSGLGLGAGDLLWWPMSTVDRREMNRRLRFIRPATSFRTAYAYDNVLYNVAGELIETVSGETWEDFVGRRIMARVGMTASSPRASAAAEARTGGNVAATHAPVEGVVREVAPFTTDNANPAAGITAGAEDMARWLLVQLDSGRLADGSRLYSPRSAREMWTLVTPMPIGAPPPELAFSRPNFAGYALGFSVRDYRGQKMVTHTGGLPGFVSQLTMIPDLKLGVVVLTNMESGGAFNSITRHVLDHYLGARAPDYAAIYKRQEARGASSADSVVRAAFARRDSLSTPSLPLSRYAGTYSDPWYGDVTIALEGGKLVMRFAHTPQLVGDLAHFQHDTFVARWREREMRADAYVTFALNPDGTIDQAKMAPVSPATDFSFDFQDLLLKPTSR